MFGVIEFAMQQPAFKQDGLRDRQSAFGRGFHFVAISAARVQGAGGAAHRTHLRHRPNRCRAEENALFEVFAGHNLRLQIAQFSLHECRLLRRARNAGTCGEISVLPGQTVEERGDKIRIAVRQRQTGRSGIELKGVAKPAMIFKIDSPAINPCRVRLMAENTIELLAVKQVRNRFARQVQRIAELQRIRIAQLFILESQTTNREKFAPYSRA